MGSRCQPAIKSEAPAAANRSCTGCRCRSRRRDPAGSASSSRRCRAIVPRTWHAPPRSAAAARQTRRPRCCRCCCLHAAATPLTPLCCRSSSSRRGRRCQHTGGVQASTGTPPPGLLGAWGCRCAAPAKRQSKGCKEGRCCQRGWPGGGSPAARSMRWRWWWWCDRCGECQPGRRVCFNQSTR